MQEEIHSHLGVPKGLHGVSRPPLLQPHFCCSLALPNTPELITSAVPLSLCNLFLLPWKPSHLFSFHRAASLECHLPQEAFPAASPTHSWFWCSYSMRPRHSVLTSVTLWIVIVLLLVCLPRLDFELNNRDLVKCTEEPGRPPLGGLKKSRNCPSETTTHH